MLLFFCVTMPSELIACISRYSCNVTNNAAAAYDGFDACISRYSCNVTAEAYLLSLSAPLIKSCEACFK